MASIPFNWWTEEKRDKNNLSQRSRWTLQSSSLIPKFWQDQLISFYPQILSKEDLLIFSCVYLYEKLAHMKWNKNFSTEKLTAEWLFQWRNQYILYVQKETSAVINKKYFILFFQHCLVNGSVLPFPPVKFVINSIIYLFL
jgi:hypothetical protein